MSNVKTYVVMFSVCVLIRFSVQFML